MEKNIKIAFATECISLLLNDWLAGWLRIQNFWIASSIYNQCIEREAEKEVLK